uniref:Uncharacterized protein n=1 Tax=Leptocylindrus danicus TaxID=163516 RepID=A0A7S2L187_9STRA
MKLDLAISVLTSASILTCSSSAFSFSIKSTNSIFWQKNINSRPRLGVPNSDYAFPSSPTQLFMSTKDDTKTDGSDIPTGYDLEFNMSSDLLESDIRKERKERETANNARFATGQDLVDLREDVANLKESLRYAKICKDDAKISALSDAIVKSEWRDPDLVYARSMEQYNKVTLKGGKSEEAAKIMEYAKDARENVNQLNLHGLWLGEAGDGYQIINVTYTGDYLVGIKIAGRGDFQKGVSVGEVVLQAPMSPNTNIEDNLDPIKLSKDSAKRWESSTMIGRYRAKARVIAEKWENGEIALISRDLFSVSVGNEDGMLKNIFNIGKRKNKLFFGRPDVTIMMRCLKDCGVIVARTEKEAALDDARDLITRCFEENDPETIGGAFE